MDAAVLAPLKKSFNIQVLVMFDGEWVLSDGEESSTSSTSSSSSSSGVPAVPAEPIVLRRGRQTGVIGPELRAVRDAILERAGVAMPAASDAALAVALPVMPRAVHVVGEVSIQNVSFLRPVGNTLYNEVVSMLQDDCAGDDEAVEAFLSHFLQTQRAIAPRKVEAELLGMDPRTMKRRILEAASICHISAKLFMASLISRVLLLVSSGDVDLVCVVCSVQYDETPLPMRASPVYDAKTARVCVDAATVLLPDNLAATIEANQFLVLKEQGTTKVVQVLVHVTMLLEVKATG
eukprot:6492632-Amphidinium_carterae.2